MTPKVLEKFPCVLLAALLCLPGLLRAQSSTLTTLEDPPAGADAVFLVRLGLGDRVETKWDGSVAVQNGELLKLVGYEFRTGDFVRPPNRWEASSRKAVLFRRRPMDEGYLKPPTGPTVLGPSFYVYLRSRPATTVRIGTAQGGFEFRAADIPLGATKKLMEGRASAERVVIPMLIGRTGERPQNGRRTDNDYPSVTIARDGSMWVSYQAYAEQAENVFAENVGRGRPQLVSPRKGDIYRTAIAEDTEGKIWVVWSERVRDNWDLYARSFDGQSWSAVERLTAASQPDTQHQLVSDSAGRLHLIWQGYRDNRAGIFHKEYTPVQGWSEEERVSAPGAPDCWDPAVATDDKGNLYVGWDQYGANSYDVWVRARVAGRWRAPVAVAATPRFEAHVSLAADPAGRVWMAWDEAGINWGKDFGYPFDIKLPGTGLYSSRHIRMAVYANGRLWEPAQALAEALPPGGINFYELPKLGVDGAGRVWVLFRHRTPLEINVHNRTPSHYALWSIYASRYEGGQWSDMMLLPYSTGLNDQRVSLARDARGRLVAAWPTDRRDFHDFATLQPDVFAGWLPEGGGGTIEPKLAPYQPPEVKAAVVHPDEPGDLKRIRAYTYVVNGKRYKIYRGDMHRHTEYSWDGYNDGSLEDVYRYALDAVDFDYIAVTEHVWGARHEYDWWRCQKAADLYRVGKRFVPLFAYERSVGFPNGHRNIVFSYRGVPELDIQGHELNPGGFPQQGAERLFAYVRRYNGIAMPHTSGTSMGTDWRDHDAAVEPLVEIYQGDRNSYERVGGWRSADPNNPATQHGGYKPEGMVSVAWVKGYRLGVQASSDHMAVHTSYAMVIAPDNSREVLLEAMRQRHTYGATDNIILDFRLVDGGSEYLMGEDVKVSTPPRFRVHVEGTDVVGDVEIVKNNRMVYSAQPGARVVDFEYRDTQMPGDNASFYYVRVRQRDPDKQVAWSSPIWVAGGR